MMDNKQKSFAHVNGKIHTSKDIKIEYPPEEFIIEKIVPKGGYTIFYGDTGSFKTLLLIEQYVDISLGLKFLNKYNAKKSNVLYLDAEMGNIQFHERLKWVLKGKGVSFDEWEKTGSIYLNKEFLMVDNEADMNILKEIIEQKNINVIIFDPLSYYHNLDENRTSDMSFMVRTMNEIMEKFGVTIMLTHHTSKLPIQNYRDTEEEQNEYRKSLSRGSSVLINSAHSAVCIKRPYKKSNIRLYFEKLKFEKEEPNKSVKLIFTEDENGKTTSVKFEEFPEITGMDKYGKTTDEMFYWIVTNKIKEFTTGDAKAHLKGVDLPHSDGAVGNALKNLIGRGLIKRKLGTGIYVVTEIMRQLFNLNDSMTTP